MVILPDIESARKVRRGHAHTFLFYGGVLAADIAGVPFVAASVIGLTAVAAVFEWVRLGRKIEDQALNFK